MSQVKITQTKGLSGRLPKQVATIKALGLGKINWTVEQDLTPQIEGMIRVVSHMVTVEDV